MYTFLTRRHFFGGSVATAVGLLVPRSLRAGAPASSPDDVAQGQQVASPEARLRQLGLVLPPPPRPVATYVLAAVVGNVLYVAGHTPRQPDGSPGYQGKVGVDFTVEEGQAAARIVALNILSTVRSTLGSLDRVARLVRTFGMVNAPPDFQRHPEVINGCSDLMVQVFGEAAGQGTRAAVGMGSLPAGMAVEIETFWEVRS